MRIGYGQRARAFKRARDNHDLQPLKIPCIPGITARVKADPEKAAQDKATREKADEVVRCNKALIHLLHVLQFLKTKYPEKYPGVDTIFVGNREGIGSCIVACLMNLQDTQGRVITANKFSLLDMLTYLVRLTLDVVGDGDRVNVDSIPVDETLEKLVLNLETVVNRQQPGFVAFPNTAACTPEPNEPNT